MKTTRVISDQPQSNQGRFSPDDNFPTVKNQSVTDNQREKTSFLSGSVLVKIEEIEFIDSSVKDNLYVGLEVRIGRRKPITTFAGFVNNRKLVIQDHLLFEDVFRVQDISFALIDYISDNNDSKTPENSSLAEITIPISDLPANGENKQIVRLHSRPKGQTRKPTRMSIAEAIEGSSRSTSPLKPLIYPPNLNISEGTPDIPSKKSKINGKTPHDDDLNSIDMNLEVKETLIEGIYLHVILEYIEYGELCPETLEKQPETPANPRRNSQPNMLDNIMFASGSELNLNDGRNSKKFSFANPLSPTPHTPLSSQIDLSPPNEGSMLYQHQYAEVIDIEKERIPAVLVDYFLVIGPNEDHVNQSIQCIKEWEDETAFFCNQKNVKHENPYLQSHDIKKRQNDLIFAPKILERFPVECNDHADAPLDEETVLSFCFPQGIHCKESECKPQAKFNVFIMTGNGVKTYGVCLIFFVKISDLIPNLWFPFSLCFITELPIINTLKDILRKLHSYAEDRITVSNKEQRDLDNVILEASIIQLITEIPVPIPGVCGTQFEFVGEAFQCSLPGPGFPFLPFKMDTFINCLGPNHICHLLACTLNEEKILFHSSNTGILPIMTESLLNIMYPLQWCCSYVPLLPRELLECIEGAIQGFIFGIHSDWLKDVATCSLMDIVVVDIDRGTVSTKVSRNFQPLPPDIQNFLHHKIKSFQGHTFKDYDSIPQTTDFQKCWSVKSSFPLSHNASCPENDKQQCTVAEMSKKRELGLRLAFALAFASLLYGYSDCLFFLSEDSPIFNSTRFLKEFAHPLHQSLLKKLVDSQAFMYFIDNHSAPGLWLFHALLDDARTWTFCTRQFGIGNRNSVDINPFKSLDEAMRMPNASSDHVEDGQVNFNGENLEPPAWVKEETQKYFHVPGPSDKLLRALKLDEVEKGLISPITTCPRAVSPRLFRSTPGSPLVNERAKKNAQDAKNKEQGSPTLKVDEEKNAQIILPKGFDEHSEMVREEHQSPKDCHTSKAAESWGKIRSLIKTNHIAHSLSGNFMVVKKVSDFKQEVAPLSHETDVFGVASRRSSSRSQNTIGSQLSTQSFTPECLNDLVPRSSKWQYSSILNPFCMDVYTDSNTKPQVFTVHDASKQLGIDIAGKLVEQKLKSGMPILAHTEESRHESGIQFTNPLLVSKLAHLLSPFLEEELNSPTYRGQENELKVVEKCLTSLFGKCCINEDGMNECKGLLSGSKFAQRTFIEILKQPNRLYGASKGPYLIDHRTFTLLEDLIGIVVDACDRTTDHSMAFSILLHSGNFFQVLKKTRKRQNKVTLVPQFLSNRIAEKEMYTSSPTVWHYVIYRRLKQDASLSGFKNETEKPSLIERCAKEFQPQKIYSQMKIVLMEMKHLDMPFEVAKEFVRSAFRAGALTEKKHNALLYLTNLDWGKEIPQAPLSQSPSEIFGSQFQLESKWSDRWDIKQIASTNFPPKSPVLNSHVDGHSICVGFASGLVGFSSTPEADFYTKKVHTAPVIAVGCTKKYIVSVSVDSSIIFSSVDEFKGHQHGVKRPMSFLNQLKRSPLKIQKCKGHKGQILCMKMIKKSESDFLVATGGDDTTVQIWEPSKVTTPLKLYGHLGPVNCLEICRDNELLYSGSQDSGVSIWDLNSARQEPESAFSGHNSGVQVVKQLGRQSCISGSSDRTLRIWDRRMHRCVAVLKGHNGPITCLEVDPTHGTSVYSASCDSNLCLWDIRNADSGPIWKAGGHTNRINSLLLSCDTVWSAGHDAAVHEWDARKGDLKAIYSTYHTGPIVGLHSISLQQGSFGFVTSSFDSTVLLWKMKDEE